MVPSSAAAGAQPSCGKRGGEYNRCDTLSPFLNTASGYPLDIVQGSGPHPGGGEAGAKWRNRNGVGLAGWRKLRPSQARSSSGQQHGRSTPGSSLLPMTLKVLVIDDHQPRPPPEASAESELTAELKVMAAHDAHEGLAAAAGHPDLDLVLLDLELTDTSGLSLVAEPARATARAPGRGARLAGGAGPSPAGDRCRGGRVHS